MVLTPKKAIIIQLLLYKVNWYLLVASLQVVSLIVGVVLVIAQLKIMQSQIKTHSKNYWILFLGLGTVGYVIDVFMINVGWLGLDNSLFIFSLALLWLQFIATIPMMSSLLKRPWLAFAVGAVGGPFAYYGGQTMGVITLGIESLVTLALVYGLVLVYGAKIHNTLAIKV